MKSIVVKFPSLPSFFMEVANNEQFSQIFKRIQTITNLKDFKLLYQGKILNSSSKIESVSLNNCSTLSGLLPMYGGGKVKFTLQAVNSQQKIIQVDDSLTGYQLKQFIHTNACQSLSPSQMQIYYAGVKILDNKQLKFYKLGSNPHIKIQQTKCSLEEIQGLIVAYQPDETSLEEVTARMPCGHVIGRDSMTAFLKSLIDSHKYQIRCPSYTPQGNPCQCIWDYNLCKKVGVLTKEQKRQFQQGFNKIWMSKFTNQCPKCSYKIYKGQLESNRVVCPNCNYGDFCYRCLSKWKKSGFLDCGNSICKGNQQILQNCPMSAQFSLKRNGKFETFNLPKYRACPKCYCLIQWVSNCKHMHCINCQTNFCYVCLDTAQQTYLFKCGSYNDYCGTIAPIQQLPQNN